MTAAIGFAAAFFGGAVAGGSEELTVMVFEGELGRRDTTFFALEAEELGVSALEAALAAL